MTLYPEELAEHLGAQASGPRRPVRGLSAIDCPRAETVAVALTAEQVTGLEARGVSCLVIPKALEVEAKVSLIRVDNPRLALAQLSALFKTYPEAREVHASAQVHDTVSLGKDVLIGDHAVIGANAVIADGVAIGPGCVVGREVSIGASSRLYANVSLYDGVILGQRVILHSGVVIGSDGFGYVGSARGAVKIEHLGAVEIGDEVEIGANSCIDRGTICPTRIGARTKIDNLCQIAHNVQIGTDCLIAGQVGIAGSTTIGDGVIIGGAAGISDHLRIGSGVRIAGMAGISKNIPDGDTWAGMPAKPHRKWVRELYLIGQLERIWQSVKGRERS